MSTKPDKNKPKEALEQPVPLPPPPSFSIFFQLEDIGVDGRKATFDVLKKALKDQKIELTVPMFSHYCLHSVPSVYLPTMVEALGAGKASVEKLVDEVNGKIADQLTGNGVRFNPALGKIIEAGREHNISAGAITALPESTAQSVAAKLGFDAMGIRLIPSRDVTGHFPGRRYLVEGRQAHLAAAPSLRSRGRQHGGFQGRPVRRYALRRGSGRIHIVPGLRRSRPAPGEARRSRPEGDPPDPV
jgi:hypothetical protein